jgi:1,4-dihydroxy-2-naphthoate octaprenyltransferase
MVMKKYNPVGVWLKQIRAPFLLLAAALVMLGGFAAFSEVRAQWGHFYLLLAGVVLAHVSVNLFNELSDFKTGIDRRTVRTPFSGGSGMMQAKLTSPAAARAVAYVALGAAFLIGLYFSFLRGWILMVFILLGGTAIRFYTSHLSKMLLGEIFSGLCLGSFVVLGVYFSLTGKLTPSIVLLSLPPGILTFLLLFLNEFPDLEADRFGGRRHLVILLGRKRSSYLYMAGLAVVYLSVLAAYFAGNFPVAVLLGLLSLPLAVKAAATVLKDHSRPHKLVAAQGMNVLIVLLTDILLAVSFPLSKVF